jgi:signal transduction histidine kinase/Tfp pilus assembly protein PilF
MNIKLQLAYMLLPIFIIDNIHAQSIKIDSLEKVLKLHKADDTVKVNLLNEIAYNAYKDDANKTLSYATQAGELSDKVHFLKGKAESLWVIGSSLTYSNSNKMALEYYLKAVKIAEEINFIPGMIKYLIGSGTNYATTGNISAAIECFEKARKIAEKYNDKPSIAKCILRLCVIYTGQGDYKKAISGYQKLIPFCIEIKNTETLSSALTNMGCIQEYQGNYSKAQEYYHKALKVSEENNNKVGCIYNYVNIGAILATQANYKEALEYIDKALKIALELNDKRRIAVCYENIGDVYSKTNNAKALEYLQKALAIGEELSYTTSMLDVSRKIGEYYRVHGNYAKSLEYYRKALNLAEEMKRKRAICEIWYKIGNIHLSQKEYAVALKYTLNSLEIANELKILTFQRDIRNQLSEIYAATNNFTKAYKNHKLYKSLNDSIYKDENIKKIIELEYTYKFEKEKKVIELEEQKKDIIQASEKKQQRIILFAFMGSFILMSLIAFYIYLLYRLKHKTTIILTKQKDEIEAKNAEIETKNNKLQELNATKDKFFGIIAHDLKNPFNAILGFSDLLVTSGYQYNQERTLEIVGIINSSAQNAYKLLENLLEWSRSQTGGINYNPKNLAFKNLVIENENLCKNLLEEKNISITHDIPNNLMVYADQNMLNAILRNLITNAIKFTHKGGNITITSIIQNTEIIITVSDTGIGMNEDTRNKLFNIHEKISILGTEKENGTGLGLILCKEFVAKQGGKIWVESELGRGSDFKFSIPLIIESDKQPSVAISNRNV